VEDDERDCYGVRLGKEYLCELDEHRIAVRVARGEIRAIALRYGIAAERPIPSFVLGVVLALFGLAVGVALARWAWQGGRIPIHLCLGTGSIPVGAWLMLNSIRKRHFLEVSLANDVRKLAFQQAAPEGELREFAGSVARAVPCPVRFHS
jgi:hypothetical protein